MNGDELGFESEPASRSSSLSDEGNGIRPDGQQGLSLGSSNALVGPLAAHLANEGVGLSGMGANRDEPFYGIADVQGPSYSGLNNGPPSYDEVDEGIGGMTGFPQPTWDWNNVTADHMQDATHDDSDGADSMAPEGESDTETQDTKPLLTSSVYEMNISKLRHSSPISEQDLRPSIEADDMPDIRVSDDTEEHARDTQIDSSDEAILKSRRVP